jgi:DNA-binding NarL/FixJ family response regulator
MMEMTYNRHEMAGDKLKVLLVEDSQLLSDRLLELMSDINGVTPIGTVDTEAAAIKAIDSEQPQAILLDLNLKEGTGFGVLRHINTMSQRPAVVVITNYALPQYRRQAEVLGARYFLDKTQEFELIPETLEALRNEKQKLSS